MDKGRLPVLARGIVRSRQADCLHQTQLSLRTGSPEANFSFPVTQRRNVGYLTLQQQ